eukprot:CAMPEP_0113680382 /NCGR_PEP_ID=MMETSP0038_2-20120614/11279_1 /TAXON_ID=2898 /ORGANISM="Cryptomonas paramecium" /LENGTH=154 /DNA_ID=CAMNT_0000598739 /DNA_START=48 /DNA_END=513 /DNA_ORIENTATION=+ /assembly_acc=CAM_ASM_000170
MISLEPDVLALRKRRRNLRSVLRARRRAALENELLRRLVDGHMPRVGLLRAGAGAAEAAALPTQERVHLLGLAPRLAGETKERRIAAAGRGATLSRAGLSLQEVDGNKLLDGLRLGKAMSSASRPWMAAGSLALRRMGLVLKDISGLEIGGVVE